MRIISGIAKGLKLAGPPTKNLLIRPTSDRSREALFSILGDKIYNSKIIDLFAGTGALGLEALSRGGSSAIFVDNNSVAISIIKKNVHSFLNSISLSKEQKQVSIIKADIRKGISPLYNTYDSIVDGKFDIIFLDPPYDKKIAEKILFFLSSGDYLHEDGVIVVEERAKCFLPESLHKLTLFDKRNYGDTGFWFYRHGTNLI